MIGSGYETTVGVNGMYQDNGFGAGTDFPIPAYHQFDFGPFFVIKRTFNKLDLSAGARYDTRTFNGKAAYIDNSDETFPTLYTVFGFKVRITDMVDLRARIRAIGRELCYTRGPETGRNIPF